MSKIKRNTMPLITQGPLQAFDVELETAGLCVSVCMYALLHSAYRKQWG